MRKIQILGVMFCAALALGVVIVSSAFGDATHLWLVNGLTVEANLPAETVGEILLEEMKNKVQILCSGKFVGTVGPEGKDEITLVEDLVGNDVEGSTNTLSITCNYDELNTGPCEGVTEENQLVLVFPINLPWATELELVGTVWVNLITNAAGNPGYLVECTVLGIKADISCTGNTGGLVENETGGVLGEFRPEEETISAKATCTTPLGNGEGLVFNDTVGLITSSSGTLSISEP